MYSATPPPLHADMIIKVCGMRDLRNIADVATLSPMLMGFIFYPGSQRNAIGLDPEVIRSLPDFIRPVAVTVDMPTDKTLALCRHYGIKIAQLHGNETPSTCRCLREEGLTVFKAAGISTIADIAALDKYEGCADMLVLDTKTPYKGGSGRKFDWRILEDYRLPVPYLLSGGIGPHDVKTIVSSLRPGMAGIDINSRFESSPGIKDITLLMNFILSLRKYNEHEPSGIPFWEKTK